MEMKIKQIISAAPGWVARFQREDGTVDETPVAVWAVIEDGCGVRVSGFSGIGGEGLGVDDEMLNFLGWFMK